MSTFMEYITNAHEASEIDRLSISEIGIPSLVLMERASMAVFSRLLEKFPQKQNERILAVCGSGNNGGDGVCVARLLFHAGYDVTILLIGDEHKRSEELKTQIKIAKNLGMAISGKNDFEEYTIIIDAIFGIGLKREVQGEYAECIDRINKSSAYVVSVDIPSGISTDNGSVLGKAVFANMTVTFGTNKRGNILFPGHIHAGETYVADIGFPDKAVRITAPKAYTYSGGDIFTLLPERKPRTNKGNYGKVLVIAGSHGMSGACFFAAMAAYRMGCGLVKILSTKDNLAVLKAKIPEALFGCYEEREQLFSSLGWADVVAFGPGIGDGETSRELFKAVFEFFKGKKQPKAVIDADGLNLLAKESKWDALLDENFVLTPHLKEMSRLTGISVDEIKENIIDVSTSHSGQYTLVLKDARTIVAGGGSDSIYINTTGNNALATGGSGDVLCGMAAGLLAQGKNPREAAELAVCIHGLAADSYVRRCNPYSMIASDILDELAVVLKNPNT